MRSLKGLFICQKLDHTKEFTVDSNLLKEEKRLKLLEDKLVEFLNQNSNDNEIILGNDNENCIVSDNEANKEYLNMKDNKVRKDDDILVNEFLAMKENAMNYINSSIAKKFEDEVFIGLITNYKGDLWHVEYEDGDEKRF